MKIAPVAIAALLMFGLLQPAAGAAAAAPVGLSDYPVQAVPFSDVKIADDFFGPRIETNRKVTIPASFDNCEKTGRISNFAKAGGLMDGEFEGIFFNDSDVYKIIEGAAYSLALRPDPGLESYLDGLIAKIAAAQEEDGYLYTARTIDPQHPPSGSGPERWSNLGQSHELYNVGHMYEAAVAYFQATGKRLLLDVAEKNAELVGSVFGPDKKHDVPGHQEIEIGLVKLFRLTGEQRCLDLARFFLAERGHACGRTLYGEYCQDHRPVKAQDEAVGHAVRAAYMYSAMADVAALTADPAFSRAIDRIWQHTVAKKLYLTGGIGSQGGGEAFGPPYELPNKTAYCETCAAIANAMWNHRLFLLHGDARYLDVLERVVYNGFLAGVALGGDTFFYVNPLESDGQTKFNHGSALRQSWFGCACCPPNVARFVPSLPGYAYAHQGDELFVNLYIAGSAKVGLDGGPVDLEVATDYPWDGRVRIAVDPEEGRDFTIKVRIPGWARGEPVPSDLYRYLDAPAEKVGLAVNAEPVPLDLDRGFASIRRTWRKGDSIELQLPMPVRRVMAHPKVAEDKGRVALERGPIVYCAEGIDNSGRVRSLFLPDDVRLHAEHRPDLLGGIETITGEAVAVFQADGSAGVKKERQPFMAIPYFAWAHRGAGEMAVWLPRTEELARPVAAPTLASEAMVSASHCYGSDSLAAVNDQAEPASSADASIPRFTWWDHRGTKEWIEMAFPQAAEVWAASVWWFDDSGTGQCRVPASWRLLHRQGDAWQEAEIEGGCGVEKDRYNRVEFSAVKTEGLKIEVELQPGFSGGILEWRVEGARSSE